MNHEEHRRQNKLIKSKTSTSPTALDDIASVMLEEAKALFEVDDYEAADEISQDVAAKFPLDAAPFHLRALI